MKQREFYGLLAHAFADADNMPFNIGLYHLLQISKVLTKTL